jgi:hypothetical protein
MLNGATLFTCKVKLGGHARTWEVDRNLRTSVYVCMCELFAPSYVKWVLHTAYAAYMSCM